MLSIVIFNFVAKLSQLLSEINRLFGLVKSSFIRISNTNKTFLHYFQLKNDETRDAYKSLMLHIIATLFNLVDKIYAEPVNKPERSGTLWILFSVKFEFRHTKIRIRSLFITYFFFKAIDILICAFVLFKFSFSVEWDFSNISNLPSKFQSKFTHFSRAFNIKAFLQWNSKSFQAYDISIHSVCMKYSHTIQTQMLLELNGKHCMLQIAFQLNGKQRRKKKNEIMDRTMILQPMNRPKIAYKS